MISATCVWCVTVNCRRRQAQVQQHGIEADCDQSLAKILHCPHGAIIRLCDLRIRPPRPIHIRLEQVDYIKSDLFPKDSLQERSENFGLFYVKWGQQFIDELIRNFEPLDFKFSVLTEA